MLTVLKIFMRTAEAENRVKKYPESIILVHESENMQNLNSLFESPEVCGPKNINNSLSEFAATKKFRTQIHYLSSDSFRCSPIVPDSVKIFYNFSTCV